MIVVATAAALTTVVVGPRAWFDYLDLLLRVSAPVTTPHNFTPGAVAYQLGATEQTAGIIQLTAMATTVAAVVAAIRWAEADASFIVTIVATQLLSPLLWDHYAVVLLLPVAWLLERRHWWAVLIPLAMALPLVAVTPPIVYPVAFAICLVAPAIVGWRHWTSGLGAEPAWLG
jgi:hypothetical protein